MKYDETAMLQEKKERFAKSVSLSMQEGTESGTPVKGLDFDRAKDNLFTVTVKEIQFAGTEMVSEDMWKRMTIRSKQVLTEKILAEL